MLFSYFTVALLIILGMYTILTYSNLIKIAIGINIIESALILLLITTAFRPGGTAPVLDFNYQIVADPIPQALSLTAIVINASTTALMLALIIKLYKRYGTLDINEIRQLRG